jgi:hypothetical protein
LLHVPVVVQAAGLITSAYELVEYRAHVVSDLITQSNQEQEILLRGAVKRALFHFEATAQVPILEATVACSLKTPTSPTTAVVAILDPLTPIVSVQKIRPCDIHKNDEGLRLEFDQWVVEDLYPC